MPRRHPTDPQRGSEARHRIEHFAIATGEQVARAARLEVTPVPQGVFISEFGDGILASLGAQRAAGTYRMRSLLDAGITVPGSTDAPVSEANPFVCLEASSCAGPPRGRTSPRRAGLSVAEAIPCLHLRLSLCRRPEADLGTLEIGKCADYPSGSARTFSRSSRRHRRDPRHSDDHRRRDRLGETRPPLTTDSPELPHRTAHGPDHEGQ